MTISRRKLGYFCTLNERLIFWIRQKTCLRPKRHFSVHLDPVLYNAAQINNGQGREEGIKFTIPIFDQDRDSLSLATIITALRN